MRVTFELTIRNGMSTPDLAAALYGAAAPCIPWQRMVAGIERWREATTDKHSPELPAETTLRERWTFTVEGDADVMRVRGLLYAATEFLAFTEREDDDDEQTKTGTYRGSREDFPRAA